MIEFGLTVNPFVRREEGLWRALGAVGTRIAALVGALLLAVVFGPRSLRAQVPQKVIATDVDDASSVHAADLDGDSGKDVLSASFGDGEVIWYENQIGESGADEDGFGDQQVITDSAAGALSVFAADLDGDGDTDVLSASIGDDEIAWYENQIGESGADEDGFGPQQTIAVDTDDAGSVYAADLDGDGDPDVLSASFGESNADARIAWYENQVGKNGADEDGFGVRQTIATSTEDFRSVHASDLDGDSDPDVLSGSSVIAWHENQIGESGADGDGFGTQQTIVTSNSGATSVHSADVDGDGDADALSSSGVLDAGEIAWYENQIGESGADEDGFGGQQTIAPSSTIVPSVGATRSVHASDLDGDGDPEVLSAFSGASDDDEPMVAWYENQVGESGADEDGFGGGRTITTSVDGPESVFTSDLAGDGDPDVLSASSDDGKIAWYENTEGVLPVELAGFEATVDGGTVHLTWQTASETKNAGFEVQRRVASTPGVRRGAEGANGGEGAWTTVGSVEGSGTTTEAQRYRFTDDDLPYAADRLDYRLRQVDTDGTAHVSGTVTVERGVTEVELLGTYPNPARSRATVRYALPEKQEATIHLYDVLGRRVRTVVSGPKEGRHGQTLDTSSLPSGVYFLRLETDGQVRTQKLTVVR